MINYLKSTFPRIRVIYAVITVIIICLYLYVYFLCYIIYLYRNNKLINKANIDISYL